MSSRACIQPRAKWYFVVVIRWEGGWFTRYVLSSWPVGSGWKGGNGNVMTYCQGRLARVFVGAARQWKVRVNFLLWIPASPPVLNTGCIKKSFAVLHSGLRDGVVSIASALSDCWPIHYLRLPCTSQLRGKYFLTNVFNIISVELQKGVNSFCYLAVKTEDKIDDSHTRQWHIIKSI